MADVHQDACVLAPQQNNTMAVQNTFCICLLVVVALMVTPIRTEENITEALESVFNFTNYNNKCNFSDNQFTDTAGRCGEFSDFCLIYNYMVFQAMEYACTLNNSAVYYLKTINIWQWYYKRYQQFNNKTERLTQSVYDLYNIVHTLESCNNLNKKFFVIGNVTFTSKALIDGLSGSPYKQIEQMLHINRLIRNTTSECKEYYESARNLTEFIKEKGMAGIFFTPIFHIYQLRVELIQKLIKDNEMGLAVGEEFVSKLESPLLLRDLVFSPIMYTELLIGFLGNALLLVIFVRHVEMQTPNNVMLINLSIADILTLLYNSVWIGHKEQIWDVRLDFCRTDWFFKRLSAYLSTYCLVFLSYQRFQAVSRFKSKRKFTEKQVAMMMTLALWIVGILLALPEAPFAQIMENSTSGSCFSCEEVMPYMWYIRLVIVYVIPLVFVPICSILTSILLKKSADNFPGQKAGNEERIQNRIIAAWALCGLVVLLAVSYIPIFIMEQVFSLHPRNYSGKSVDVYKRQELHSYLYNGTSVFITSTKLLR
ncbi:hypothetical protein C0J52_21396 [Blattella germanica]|nr:hypothetical protein C0J52_21396 [Blattella germanica]